MKKHTEKFSKKQRESVKNVVYMLDELDNKPRRLYSALRDMVETFLSERDDVEDIYASLDEAEEFYYRNKRILDYARDIIQSRDDAMRELRKAEYKREEPRQDILFAQDKAVNLLAKKILCEFTDIV
jgi:hypothetical protein